MLIIIYVLIIKFDDMHQYYLIFFESKYYLANVHLSICWLLYITILTVYENRFVMENLTKNYFKKSCLFNLIF